MLETNLLRGGASGIRGQRGSTVIEFALIALTFFVFIFGILELARLMFIYNTLYDATRRAATLAASADFSNTANMDAIRQRAIFRTSPGGLILMPELTDKAIRIDYMSLSLSSSGALSMQAMTSAAVPNSPADNLRNCLADPYGPSCVRLVRVRVCDPAQTGECKPIHFTALTALVKLHVDLPTATTIAQVQTLGLQPN